MKGLEYIRIESNIAWDGDLEQRSAEAFRMFIELIGISAHDLSDGKVPIERAKKLCNSTHFDTTLDELTNARMVALTNTDTIVVRNYQKYQLSKAEVLQMRAKNRDRVMRYRQRYSHVTNGERNACVMPEYREQSKSKSITPPLCSPPKGEDTSLLGRLVSLCREKIPGWKASDKDEQVVRLGLERLGEKTLRNLVLKLATRQAASGEYKDPRRALANWINREEIPAEVKPDRPRVPIEEALPAWDNPNAAIISGDPIPEEFLREEW